jgi:mono/diheme cytochrome c family protein
MKIKKLIMLAFAGTVAIANVNAQDGEQIFNSKGCAACHTIGGGQLVGPDLAGVLDRRPESEIIKFVQNPADFDITMMPPQNVTDIEVKAILDYILSKSPSEGDATKEVVEIEEVVVAMDDVKAGELLFEGTTSFENGGASCITCHNVDYEQMMQGGLLAKDLTDVYTRVGGMNGIGGVLSGLPFPAMKATYGNNPLTDIEITQLQAFLKDANDNRIYQHHGEKETMFLHFGVIGFISILILIFFLWFNKKKGGVKDEIFNRQTKSI